MSMLAVIVSVCLLLPPALAGGSTVQQGQLCTDSYAEFEKASIGSNISGNNIRNQLYEAFYAPNQHLPFSVNVNYQLLLVNGTRLNLSSKHDCSSELWKWLSTPVFLVIRISSFNHMLLFTPNYFMKWDPPHVTITTTTAPCPAEMEDFLSEMTASLQNYALGQTENKAYLGYVKRGCGTSIPYTSFSVADRRSHAKLDVLGNFYRSGLVFQVVFVWIVSVVLLKMTFKEFAQETFTYSYDMYGMFWGVSTTAAGLMGVLLWTYTSTAFVYIVHLANTFAAYLLLSLLFSILVAELPVAICAARKSTVAVPCIFKYPARLLCCCRQRRAERLVTTIALWVDLVALQLSLYHGSLFVLTLSAAPFAIASNMMVVVLALSCLANIFSLLYTIFAHFCTPSHQRVHSSSMVLRAVVVVPLLPMMLCYGVVVANIGSVTNVDAKSSSNSLSFINSIATPILLGVISIFLKRFISVWLKWSPQGTEQVKFNDSLQLQGQDVDDELLDP